MIQMILSFNKISKTSALIQLPYLIWTMFAGYINLGVYLLNR
ncbi:MAG: tryptophan-rich sensory protein [Ruminococcus sp.]|nr:tryptophan-rich sensory protein [Ruminococcus sp.]